MKAALIGVAAALAYDFAGTLSIAQSSPMMNKAVRYGAAAAVVYFGHKHFLKSSS